MDSILSRKEISTSKYNSISNAIPPSSNNLQSVYGDNNGHIPEYKNDNCLSSKTKQQQSAYFIACTSNRSTIENNLINNKMKKNKETIEKSPLLNKNSSIPKNKENNNKSPESNYSIFSSPLKIGSQLYLKAKSKNIAQINKHKNASRTSSESASVHMTVDNSVQHSFLSRQTTENYATNNDPLQTSITGISSLSKCADSHCAQQKYQPNVKMLSNLPDISNILRKSLTLFMDNMPDVWKENWSLKFNDSQLENNFNIYFAYRYLLSNQATFLLFNIIYILMLFIFNVPIKYSWISVVVQCCIIVLNFVGFLLTLLKSVKIYIHLITVCIIFTLIIGLNIQATFAEIPISAESLLSVQMVLFGMCAFLSVRYKHVLCLFISIFLCINLQFIFIIIYWSAVNHIFSHFLWYNMLLIFGMACSGHLVRVFEIQERKMFIRVLRQLKEARSNLQRQLTLYETVNIAQLIENDRTGNDGDVMDKLLNDLMWMGGLFQHFPEHPQSIINVSEVDKENQQLFSNIVYHESISPDIQIVDENTCNKIIITPENMEAKSDAHDENNCQTHNNLLVSNVNNIERNNTATIDITPASASPAIEIISNNTTLNKNSIHSRGELQQIAKLIDLPAYYNPYPFVPIGYRMNYTYKQALLSIFQWHNETINLWTEIIPLIINILYLYIICKHNPTFSLLNTYDQTLFITAAVCVLIIRPIASTLAHTFYFLSKNAHDFWWRLDYASICLTVFAESVVSSNYTFECSNQLKLLFFTCMTCMFISTLFSTLVSDSMQIRAASFCLFAVFGTGLPFIYNWIRYLKLGHDWMLDYLEIWTSAYAVAVFALVLKSLWFPERCTSYHRRECLSYVGFSHQLWHILINSCLTFSVYGWMQYLESKYSGNIDEC